MITTSTSIDQYETFRLDDNCIAIIWHENDGWHGNLHWILEGDGPYNTINQARQAVRYEFSLRPQSSST